MKFRIRLKRSLSPSPCGTADMGDWWEDYDEPEVVDQRTADAWAKALIKNFNATLRLLQCPRTLLEVRLDDDQEDAARKITPHSWRKTSLVTQVGGFDWMVCEVCGIKGKRFGLGDTPIQRQGRKWSKPEFADCELCQLQPKPVQQKVYKGPPKRVSIKKLRKKRDEKPMRPKPVSIRELMGRKKLRGKK